MVSKWDLEKVWQRTPRDYKGVNEDGIRQIMICRGGSTDVVALEDLTEKEVNSTLRR